MKAFVLAGGLGTRLRPRFGELPKALAPLGGRPFLIHQLEWLARHGVREAVLCVGHGAAEIEQAARAAEGLGVTVHTSREETPLGTAGALARARARVDGPCWVLNGDTLPDGDPWALMRARWERGAVGAIALFEAEDATARGRVECDPDGRIVAFVEKDEAARGTAWVNGGLYAFSAGLWRHLPARGSLEREVLPVLARDGLLIGLRCPGTFYDIGTPAEWERAERHFAR